MQLDPIASCTAEERERIHATTTVTEAHPRSRFGTVSAEHPTRLAAEFRHGQRNAGHEILSVEPAGDGWERVTYLLSPVTHAELSAQETINAARQAVAASHEEHAVESVDPFSEVNRHIAALNDEQCVELG